MTRGRIRPADVVLGALDGPRRAEAERLMRDDASFREEVEHLRAVGNAVAAVPGRAWVPAPPPALDLSAALAVRPETAAAGGGGRRGRLRTPVGGARGGLVLRPAVALVCAAALVTGGVAAGVTLSADDTPPREWRVAAPPTRIVALSAFGEAGAQRATVRLPRGMGGTVALAASGVAPSRPGEYYELWLLDDAENLTAVGTFRVGASGAVRGRFPVGVDPSAYRYVDVSREVDDGDPAHSRRSVLRSSALS